MFWPSRSSTGDESDVGAAPIADSGATATVSDSGTTAVADGAACGGGQERAAAVSRRLLVTQRLLAADSVNSRDSFIRWGWSRSERARLVRLQAVARGWLLRRKVCQIPARDVEAVLKDLHQKDKGLRRLVVYLCFMMLFYGIAKLETPVSFQHSVDTGLRDLVDSVTFGPENLHLGEVGTRRQFADWSTEFFLALYDGTEVEDVCNSCAAARSATSAYYMLPSAQELWGTPVTVPASNGTAASSFLFEFDHCPMCYDSETSSSVSSGSDEGKIFCDMCSGFEFCFEDACDGYDIPRATYADVKGTDPSMIKVQSAADCPAEVEDDSFLKTYGASVGFTSSWLAFADARYKAFDTNSSAMDGETYVMEPTGSGYVANKNRIVGAILYEWTYYENATCTDTEKVEFYSPCYKDVGSKEDQLHHVEYSLNNAMGHIFSMQADPSSSAGREYSALIDAGVYDMGLNENLCGILAFIEGDAVINGGVRTLSVRFNTYNGQSGGLFSAVKIEAKFSLGGEVQISPVVNVFSLSPFLTNHSSDEVVERTVQIFLFAVMLFCYIVGDLQQLWKELKDGRRHFSFTTRKAPIATATLIYIWGDILFVFNFVFWIKAAVAAGRFKLETTLPMETAVPQVLKFSEELEALGLRRWEQEALLLAGSMLGLARLFLLLRFHPRLSLVTDVLAASAVHLVHFFIMFFMVVAVYSNVGWIVFGPSSDLFMSWTASFVTMTRTALGEFDNIYPEMVEINPDAAFLIIATYQTLQFILLLNIVISILVDAFQGVQDRNRLQITDTLMETVLSTLGRWRLRLVNMMCGLLCRFHARTNTGANKHGFPTYAAFATPTKGGPSRLSTATIVQHRKPAPKTPKQHIRDSRGHPHQRRQGDGREDRTPPASTSRLSLALDRLQHMSGLQGKRPQLSRANSSSTRISQVEKGVAGVTWTGRIGVGTEGLTRAQRLQVSYRHYDLRTAAEVLRRSPLPEKAVWRKMRQIVESRLGPSAAVSEQSQRGVLGAPSVSGRMSSYRNSYSSRGAATNRGGSGFGGKEARGKGIKMV